MNDSDNKLNRYKLCFINGFFFSWKKDLEKLIDKNIKLKQ